MTIACLLVIPLISGLLAVLSPAKRFLQWVFVSGAALLAGCAWALVFRTAGTGPRFEFGGNILLDPLAAVFVFLIATVGLLSAVYAAGYLFGESDLAIPLVKLKRYAIFFHLFLLSMLLVVLSNNLGIMWIAIEGTTLASAFLVNVDDKKSSIEAAWKYLILCTVGIALALFGIILVYYSATSGGGGEGQDLLHWSVLLSRAATLDPQIMKLAFVFILAGYGTKAGLAPFHSWLPDAHSQAPSPVSALLSGVLLSCSISGIIRFHILTRAAVGGGFSDGLLIFFGVLSVAVACPFILVQGDYKRLLAYSSVEHMGLTAAGIGFGSFFGVYGALLHIVNHAFTKSLLFFSCGHILHHFRTKEIRGVRGLLKTSPFLGTVFFAGILAIAGLPPFSVFVSEFSILSGGFASRHFGATAAVIALLVLIFAGFVRHLSEMALGERVREPHPSRNGWMDGVLWIGLFLIVSLGIYIPGPFQDLLHGAVRVVEGAGG
ncbi:MAG: hydrogenase 4 subunit F [Candidatus Omnitrophica bacterium]|nr:hydrogenase 4 subunit F [Candidatus Omnitrophota bacterium]